MTILEAVQLAESEVEEDEGRLLEAWQLLIDTGIVWKLQGSFGRFARDLIECGYCTP